MADDVHKIIAGFKAKRWEAAPYERTVAILADNPAAAAELVRRVIGELREGPTFLAYAIDCLPDVAFPELVPFALDAFGDNPENEGAEDLISHASLQSPPSLHPHLDRIFHLQPNWSTYYAQWPWRGSGDAHQAFLKGIVNNASGVSQIRKFPGRPRTAPEAAMSAMLETRQPDALRFVWEKRGDEAIDHLLMVGFEGPEQGFRKLYTDTSLHLCFPSDYFRDAKTPVHLVKRHPTWHLSASTVPSGRFGGDGDAACQCCGGALHNIITLPSIPPNLGVTKMAALSLQTCLSCLGWEEDASQLFYQHDDRGIPSGLMAPTERVIPEWPATPLRETAVVLSLTPRRWFWQDWALSNSRQNLNRLGSHPAWIQNAGYMTCPSCRQRMPHLLQLDSDLPTRDGGEWQWGSGGCCYVGWCDRCKVSGFTWQCT